ncbi:efflux transporter outer membrane subunit [Rhodoferax sp.]|uniref:efflux transporter outer membrane subunit n=1 Tax=Rhodoferax sp. TaxID=50421 RepID=UPI00272F7019|nr:efflux transporter outer membrane subunit [Rhodoferax sp.]MDP1531205.1 efflux transporter outer membrane subunit [Rhodoferax sp.]MDP1942255.1 efflux transporter outer membrane subunit [Rhodoferax sp.]MDP2441275.1 efflux transporter outer membrane subunit [Rhodoferax sp.]MDZ4207931.1 efflux transporter outer membrane subunit [Rhodoferax sp.]
MRHFKLTALALAAALLAAPGIAQQTGALATTAIAATAAPANAVSAAGWWAPLGDPTLSALIQQGLDGNLDIMQARERIGRSQALLKGAEAAARPSGAAGLQGRAAQASETEAPGMSAAQRRSNSVQLGLEFSWEIDLFGRLDAQSTAARERLTATEVQVQGVRLAVSAEIAHAYFSLIEAREQLQLARTVAENRQRTLNLVQARAHGGLAAPIDDLRAQGELEAARADIPVQEAAALVAMHRLAVLTGTSPAGFELASSDTVQPSTVALHVPEATLWMARRPDILAQEAELRARALDVRSVRAEFYPRLSITGVLGFVAGSVTGLGSAGSVSWLSAPSLMAPLFDRPRIEARLAAAKADQKEALNAYRQRILLATEEVENALARYNAGHQHFNALQRRAQYAAQAERLSRVRFEAGATDLLELLDAQRTAQQSQAALAHALMQQRQHLVAVFKGIGGGTGAPG